MRNGGNGFLMWMRGKTHSDGSLVGPLDLSTWSNNLQAIVGNAEGIDDSLLTTRGSQKEVSNGGSHQSNASVWHPSGICLSCLCTAGSGCRTSLTSGGYKARKRDLLYDWFDTGARNTEGSTNNSAESRNRRSRRLEKQPGRIHFRLGIPSTLQVPTVSPRSPPRRRFFSPCSAWQGTSKRMARSAMPIWVFKMPWTCACGFLLGR